MAFVGGDVIELSISSPDKGNLLVYPKSGEDNKFDPGGYRNNDEANGITGSGTLIVTKNMVRGSLELVCPWDMNVTLDVEKVKDFMSSTLDCDFVATIINGAQYAFKGVLVGDLSGGINTATFSIKAAIYPNSVSKLA